jgi:hypothetical protein
LKINPHPPQWNSSTRPVGTARASSAVSKTDAHVTGVRSTVWNAVSDGPPHDGQHKAVALLLSSWADPPLSLMCGDVATFPLPTIALVIGSVAHLIVAANVVPARATASPSGS